MKSRTRNVLCLLSVDVPIMMHLTLRGARLCSDLSIFSCSPTVSNRPEAVEQQREAMLRPVWGNALVDGGDNTSVRFLTDIIHRRGSWFGSLALRGVSSRSNGCVT